MPMSSPGSGASPDRLIRPLVRDLHAYVPGEQPQIPGLIKLNTNENPYPPAPAVLKAVKAAVDGRLRLYPSPNAGRLREALATMHGCDPGQVIVGNGSDELLALATRAFVEPRASFPRRRGQSRSLSRATVQYFWPSYSLYPVLAAIHGAQVNPHPLPPDFSLPEVKELRQGGRWDFRAALTLVTTPNAPSGMAYPVADLDALCKSQKGVTLLDEAYVDFAPDNAMSLAFKHPHVLVSRTFSKAYSLCFQRVGYFVGSPDLVGALDRIRDSYNVNGLGQVAALATLENLDHYRRGFRRILTTRQQVSDALREKGWQVLPSATNFILARPPGSPAKEWLEALRQERILVRWFSAPEVSAYLRITIGSDTEMETFLQVVSRLGQLLGEEPPRASRKVGGRKPGPRAGKDSIVTRGRKE